MTMASSPAVKSITGGRDGGGSAICMESSAKSVERGGGCWRELAATVGVSAGDGDRGRALKRSNARSCGVLGWAVGSSGSGLSKSCSGDWRWEFGPCGVDGRALKRSNAEVRGGD